jgi:hypothetical protein
MMEDEAIWRRKLSNLRSNATRRGIEYHLSLKQYVRLAEKADITHSDIGRGGGQYVMARKRDRGCYEIGNCRFITKEENTAEMNLYGGGQRRIDAMTGRTKETHPGVARQAMKKTGRNKHNDPSVARMAEKMAGRSKATHEHLFKMSLKRSKASS